MIDSLLVNPLPTYALQLLFVPVQAFWMLPSPVLKTAQQNGTKNRGLEIFLKIELDLTWYGVLNCSTFSLHSIAVKLEN